MNGEQIMETDPLRALVYVRPGPRSGYRMGVCGRLVDRRGWELVGVVFGEHGGRAWRKLIAQADVIVVYELAELPPDRVPRFEVAGDHPADIMPRPHSPRAYRLDG